MKMLSELAVRRGVTSSITACISGVASDSDTLYNTPRVFARISPESSYAAMVFSNVGAASLATIALTSASCCSIPAFTAGTKSEVLILSNGGKASAPVHSVRNGFVLQAEIAITPSAVKTSLFISISDQKLIICLPPPSYVGRILRLDSLGLLRTYH